MDTENMCTAEKRGRVHLITITGAGEHRLGPSLISALRAAVASVRTSPGAGALGGGFDQAWARTVPRHLHTTMSEGFRGLVADLLALPMPTVAAVTGHAAAAGCALALAHDSVVMRASRGFLYMSEVEAGIKIVDYFGELLRQKVPDAATRRDMLLRGDRMTAAEAVRRGDWVGFMELTRRSGRVCGGRTARPRLFRSPFHLSRSYARWYVHVYGHPPDRNSDTGKYLVAEGLGQQT